MIVNRQSFVAESLIDSMDRVAGIETEYGCLVSGEEGRAHTDAWPARVKNYLFRKARGRRDRPALSRLRGTARQRRLPPQRRPALSRHGAHRVRVAGMPASARRRHLRLRRRPAVAIGARSARRGGPRLVHQEQRRSPHRRDLRLPRELSDEARGAIHAAGPRHAARLSRHAPDFHRRGPRGAGEPARVRFRTAAAGGRTSIFNSASAPITSSTTFTSGCNSIAPSSTRATSRWPIIANIGGCICSSAIRT